MRGGSCHTWSAAGGWSSRTARQLSAGAAGAQVFNEANLEFMEKIIERSGLGDETGLSDGIQAMREPGAPMKTTLKQATDETEMVIFDVAGNAMHQSGVRPEEARARYWLSRFCQPVAVRSSTGICCQDSGLAGLRQPVPRAQCAAAALCPTLVALAPSVPGK